MSVNCWTIRMAWFPRYAHGKQTKHKLAAVHSRMTGGIILKPTSSECGNGLCRTGQHICWCVFHGTRCGECVCVCRACLRKTSCIYHSAVSPLADAECEILVEIYSCVARDPSPANPSVVCLGSWIIERATFDIEGNRSMVIRKWHTCLHWYVNVGIDKFVAVFCLKNGYRNMDMKPGFWLKFVYVRTSRRCPANDMVMNYI